MAAPVAPAGLRVPPIAAIDTESWSPAPSPDGTRLAYVSDHNGQPQLWVDGVAVDTGPDPVVQASWAPAGDWLACVVAPGGAPRTEVQVLRPDGSDRRQVAGFDGATGLLGAWLPAGGLVVTEAGRCWRGMVVDPSTGGRRVVVEGDLLVLLDVSPDGASALVRCGPRGGRWVELVDVTTGGRRRLHPDPALSGEGSCDRAWFSADGRTAYLRTDAGCELAALVAVELPGGPGRIVARRPDADLEDVTFSVDRDTAVLLWNRYGGTSEVTLLDLHSGVQRPVRIPGDVVDGCALSGDGRFLACTVQNPVLPRTAWVADLTSRRERMVSDHAAPRGVAPQLCGVPTTDRLTVSGWLYRPETAGPWPTVLSLHGGPESQERPGFHPLYQALVSRGIAVFAPNVRGSSGFGRSFMAADNLAGRYGAVADVSACVRYLVDRGLARGDRIGCIGRSYGGYLTMAALVTFPELFRVGVSECGISDFATFYAATEPWIAAAAVGKYGHPEQDRQLLHDLSPVHRLDRLAAPLLLIHGANDTNVPVRESAQVAQVLRECGKPHEYLLIPGEGHTFLSRAARSAAIDATVSWLTRHL